MKYIASLDKFGATYKQKLNHKTKNYKTVLGGFISIVIYLLSFLYFCYKIYQFGDNQMNPAQSIIYEYRDELTMIIQEQEQLIQLLIPSSTINPFNKTNQILTPLILRQGNDKFYSTANYTSSDTIYEQGQIDLENQVFTPTGLTLSRNSTQYPTTILIALQICNSTTNNNCAEQEIIDEFFNQSNLLIRTVIKTKQFDTLHRKFTTLTRTIDFAFDKSVIFYQRIILEPQLIDYDDAPLFTNSNQNWIFGDYQIQTQSLQQSYKSAFSGVFIAELSMSDVNQKNSIQYVKISQVLADVGSIFSSLMLFSIIISTINEIWMEEEIINSIISIYYPNFNKIKIKRRYIYFGLIKSVTYNNKQINLSSFLQFYKPAVKIAKAKLTVFSNLYHISRLQFAIQQILTRSELIKTHKEGINLPLIYEQNSIINNGKILQSLEEEQQDQIEQELEFHLQQEDYSILNKQNENYINQKLQKKITIEYDKINSQLQQLEIQSHQNSGEQKLSQQNFQSENKQSCDIDENQIKEEDIQVKNS